MGWLILVVAILVVAYLLYLGNRCRERRRLERQREAEKLEANVQGHREMSADHQARAGELRDEAAELEREADREMDKAARHEVTADELAPDPEAEQRS